MSAIDIVPTIVLQHTRVGKQELILNSRADGSRGVLSRNRHCRKNTRQKNKKSIHNRKLINVNARTLGRRQVVDTIPAHLQQQKREYNQSKSRMMVIAKTRSQMQIQEVGHPRSRSPRLLGVPRPEITPRLFGPQSAHYHTQREERPTDANKIIAHRMHWQSF